MTGRPRFTRWFTSLLALAVGVGWLQSVGSGGLAAPPLTVDGAASWLDHRDTATACFALVRLIAIGFGGYLLFVMAAGGAARYLRLPRTISVFDHITLPFARGALGSVALLGVMASPPPLQPPSPDSMIELPQEPATASTVPGDSPSARFATIHLLPDASITPTPSPPNAALDTWVVQHGESFWSIAEEHLADVNGHPVADSHVSSYWRRVVELNRAQLVNPDDPDLLFAGQVIELPAVEPG